MKVLMVNNQLYVLGGSETYMFSVGDELKKRGIEVEYFGLEDPEKKHGNRFGIYAVKSKNPLSCISNKKNIQLFANLLDQFRPDVIHLNLVYFTLTEDIIYEAKKRHIPIIHTIHDSKIVCPCHRLYIETQGRPCRECLPNLNFKRCLKNRCIKGSFLKSWLAVEEANYYKKKNTYAEIDRYIFVSHFMMEQHLGHGVEKSQSLVLHNFSRVQKRTVLNKSPEKYVLYFGRLGREKGADTLAHVCRNTPNIRYKIVGSGEMEYLFNDLGNCQMLGFKSGKELEDIIAGAVCSILPSIWYENCPMTVLESIALGTPVIGSNIGGIPELIDHGRTGLLFKSGNASELQSCLEEVFFNEEKATKMAESCLSNDSFLTIDMYVDRLIEIYNSVM